MQPLRLLIKWRAVRESIRLDLDSIDRGTKVIRTEEDWLDGTLLKAYRPRLTYSKQNDGSTRLSLDYLAEDHPEHQDMGVIWGRSIIVISPSHDSATVKWKSSPKNPSDDGPASCTVSQETVPSQAERETVIRLKRAQLKFKNGILRRESVCAASGETFQPALEAAHIQDVEDLGPNIPENGFLLRADMHKLFDDGLFWLNTDGSWCFDEGFPASYRAQFTSDRIGQSTFERVKDFIVKRRRRVGKE